MFSALLIGSAAAIVAAAIAYALGYRRGVTEKTARLNRFVESYDIAAQAADLGIWDWNLETGRLETDANMLRAFARDNAPPAPNAPGFLANVIHPDDQKEFFRAFTAAVKDRSLERFELRFRSKRQSGEVRHAQLVGRMIRDEKGWAKRFLGVSWNITAQVEADQEVARQAAAGRALVERLNLATRVAGITVWEWDARSDRMMVEDFVLRHYGAEESGALGNALAATREAVHPDDLALFDARRAEALQSTDAVKIRYRVRRLDGVYRHVESNFRAFHDAGGVPLRMLGVTRDITEEVEHAQLLECQAEEERALRDRLNLATETAGIGVWDADLVTHTLTSDAMTRKILDRDDVSTSNLWECVHADDVERVRENLNRAMRTQGEQQLMETRHRVVCRDSSVRYVQIYCRIFRGADGGARRMLGVTWDVTAEVMHMQQLERQAEHERSLLERLKIATEAAKISPWEYEISTKRFKWDFGRPSAFDTGYADANEQADFMTRVHPEDRAVFNDVPRAAMADGSFKYSFRFRIVNPDASVTHMITHAHILRDENGKPLRAVGVAADITHDVETAQKLERQALEERKLRDRISLSTQAAGIASWELDFAQQRLVWWENFAPEVATSPDPLAEIIRRQHPEDRGKFMNAVAEAVRSGEHIMKYRYRVYVGGAYTHRQNFARLIVDAAGQPTGAIGVTWDITKEVEASEEIERQARRLLDAERRLERASLSSLEGHWEWDLSTGAAWYSSSCHFLLGYPEGTLPPDAMESLALLQLPEDLAWQQEIYDRHLAVGSAYELEARLRTGSGEIRWFRIRGTAERDDTGKPVRMAGSIHDIHQQKLAEDALSLVQSRLERAVTGTQDGLWELEANGIAWCSPRVGELLGYLPGELPSETNFLKEFLHEEDRTQVASATQAHFQEAALYDVEIRLRTKSGDYRWYRARASAERDAEGRPLRLSGSLQDVTEARAAREALVHATEAAQAASRAKSDFLANVSHEIRTPMNGIIGMTGLLLDTSLDRTQQEYAETIRSSADSLLTVINDILDFSKIEAGKLDIEHLEMDLRAQVEEVGSMMALQAGAKQLELIVNVHPEVPERVMGDPQRVRQCLINLVGNAIKFTREGEIVIEVCTVGQQNGKVLTHFEVKDTGIGIAPKTLNTLFQPFVQADSSTTRHFGGTGLGLSIVRRLAEMMGGTVGVQSDVGKGSTFWFTLPLEPAVTARTSPPFQFSRLGRRVLVVDDNHTNREVLATQLKHSGYEVGVAASARAALAALKQGIADQHPFEAVLADFQMPEVDGAMLGQRINADPELKQARLVLLTSLDGQGDLKRFASLGFAGYLTKPVRAKELFDCLDRVLACESKEWHLQSQPLITRSALAAAPASTHFHGNVLLTEDNPVNQKVALRFLERLGLTVSIANNGEEAVQALERQSFDLVFMDLQMPVMDGLTATRLIRKRESEQHLAKVPIVALTANAMVGQLEVCLAAGMNDFLTKPLDVQRLKSAVEKYSRGKAPEEAEACAIDAAGWRNLTNDDAEFMRDLVETFLASGAEVLEEIRGAQVRLDRTTLARAAHKLKGASANVYATGLRDLAAELESHAATADANSLAGLVRRIERSYRGTMDFFTAQAGLQNARSA